MEAIKCAYCGKEFLSNAKKGQIYCSDKCRIATHHKKLNDRRREATALKRKKKTKEPSALSIIEAEARAMGMHYGQYVALRGV